jgi:hypothetical protein
MEEFVRKVENGELEEYENDFFDGGKTFTKAWAKDLRAAIENRPRKEDEDDQFQH